MLVTSEKNDEIYWAVTNDETQKTLMSLLTEESKEKIYREVKASYEMEDIRCRAEDIEFEIDDDEVKRAQEYMEYHHDCNITYWDNVDAAIQSATCGRYI